MAGRRVAGLDVVELAPIPGLHHADFTAAKLTHLLMGLAQGRQRPTTCGGTLMKNTAVTFREAKGGEKLVMITAYDYSTARVMDAAGVNAILVGDSLGMVMLGYEDTLSVTLDDMIRHCAAVARGTREALVVCDMPFMSYHTGVEEAVRNAGRLMVEGRAQAVKLEGGADFCPEVRALVRASIPWWAIWASPPSPSTAFGGYKVQGKTPLAAQKLLDDARALQDAGAFALVLECVPAPLAAKITQA